MIDPEAIEWDEDNETHATRHGVSVREIVQVFANTPDYQRNRKQRAGDYMATGYTDGGRRVRVAFVWDEGRRTVRPIAAWPLSR